MTHPFAAAVLDRDLARLSALLAPDVVFRSPVVFAPTQGRPAVTAILAAAMEVFQDFRYERQIGADGDADQALVFRARVGDREIQGCDFVHLDGDGLVDELLVMTRPLSATTALAQAMQQALTRAGALPPS